MLGINGAGNRLESRHRARISVDRAGIAWLNNSARKGYVFGHQAQPPGGTMGP